MESLQHVEDKINGKYPLTHNETAATWTRLLMFHQKGFKEESQTGHQGSDEVSGSPSLCFFVVNTNSSSRDFRFLESGKDDGSRVHVVGGSPL